MRKLILIASVVLLSMSSFAQKVDSAKSSISQNRKNNEINNSETINDNSTYKVLYEEIKKNNEELIDSFQWSIGSILLIIMAIFGGSIYFNFRFNKNELSNLLQQVDLKIKDIKTDLLKNQEIEIEKVEIDFRKKSEKLTAEIQVFQKNTIQTLIKENKDFVSKIENNLLNIQESTNTLFINFRTEFTTKIENLGDKYQSQLNSFNNNYTQQIETLNKSTYQQIEAISQSTTNRFDSVSNKINIFNNDFKREIEKINIFLNQKDDKIIELSKSINSKLERVELDYMRDLALTNAKLWEIKEIYSNALRYHMEAITIMRKMGWSSLDIYLNYVIDDLNKITKIHDFDYKIIENFIELISSENQILVAKIKELYEQKK